MTLQLFIFVKLLEFVYFSFVCLVLEEWKVAYTQVSSAGCEEGFHTQGRVAGVWPVEAGCCGRAGGLPPAGSVGPGGRGAAGLWAAEPAGCEASLPVERLKDPQGPLKVRMAPLSGKQRVYYIFSVSEGTQQQ